MFDGGRNGTPNGISGKVQDPVKITLVPLVLHTKDISILLGKFYRVYVEKKSRSCGLLSDRLFVPIVLSSIPYIHTIFSVYHMFGILFNY